MSDKPKKFTLLRAQAVAQKQGGWRPTDNLRVIAAGTIHHGATTWIMPKAQS